MFDNPMGEQFKKMVQMSTLFHLLTHGRCMLQYDWLQPLIAHLKVPSCSFMHWSDSSGWVLAKCMFSFVEDAAKVKVHVAPYIALSCDEVTSN